MKVIENLPFVSIVVICFNSIRHIDRCLSSLESLDYPREKYEVIVVDGGSTDGTQESIKKYPVKLLIESRRGRGLARNIGIKHAKGDIVAFVDADCKVEKNWLKIHVKNHFDGGTGAVSGAVVHPCLKGVNNYSAVFHLENFSEYSVNAPRRYVQFLPTCNASFKKNILKAVGLFDEEARIAEDFLISMKFKTMGFAIIFDPNAVVSHFSLTSGMFLSSFIEGHKIGARAHFLAQMVNKNIPGRLPMKPIVALLFTPSIILARALRQFYKIVRYTRLRVFEIIIYAPYIIFGSVVWGIYYVKATYTMA